MWNFKQSLRSGPQMLAWILYYKDMLSYVLFWGNFSKFIFIVLLENVELNVFVSAKKRRNHVLKSLQKSWVIYGSDKLNTWISRILRTLSIPSKISDFLLFEKSDKCHALVFLLSFQLFGSVFSLFLEKLLKWLSMLFTFLFILVILVCIQCII